MLQVEVFHRKFLRLILHVNRCTPDCMIYGETGRDAILSVVKCRMVSFWSRLVSGKQSTNIRIYLVQFDFKMYACRFEHTIHFKMDKHD